ncbi:MAG: hypothetical protein LC804_07645 [Acidobacteria bacterium]|nr:hypothetical protein [Acidobacteriota bacterium]
MQILPGSLFGSEHLVSVFAPRAPAGADESQKTLKENGPSGGSGFATVTRVLFFLILFKEI